MKSATNRVGGSLVELLGRSELLDLAGVHDRDPVAHRERLLLVVGHVHERDPDLGLDALELDLELAPQLEVERAERLVEEQHVGPVDQGPGERDPLLLAARQLVRLAAFVAGQVDELERFADPPRGLVLGDALALQAEGDVVADVEVGEERVVLEDHVDRALVRRIGGHVAAAQEDRPAGRELEPADHPQRRRLAAARRAEQREELAAADLERDAVDRPDLAELLLQVEELDLRGRRHRRGRHRDAEASPRRGLVLASVPGTATCARRNNESTDAPRHQAHWRGAAGAICSSGPLGGQRAAEGTSDTIAAYGSSEHSLSRAG